MRVFLRWFGVMVVVLAAWAPPLAQAANLDTVADRVFGQPDFTQNAFDNGGVSASSLAYPFGVVSDAQGHLYVTDSENNRVLEYDHPLTSAVAARVIGQPNFITNTVNNGGVSANSLDLPAGVALDDDGNLYVADLQNHRVLEYDDPLTHDTTADRVFGQPDFTHADINHAGVSASSLYNPYGVALDGEGHLYVADAANHRVLEYDHPLTSQTANRVFGQPDFTHNVGNNGGLSANSLHGPQGVAVDRQGNLFVSDVLNQRVLEYATPLSTDTTADRVLGQPSFITNTANNGGVSASGLDFPIGVALDALGNLYVVDHSNARVLEYDAPLTHDTTADRVFGQPDFTHNIGNNGGVSATSLEDPTGVALDAQGNLYVADWANQRVLEYDQPLPPPLRLFLPVMRR